MSNDSNPAGDAPPAAAGPAEEQAAAAEPAVAATDEAELLRQERDRALEQAQENHDRYLREAAELQNLRKRAVEREEKARKFAVERFASDLLNVKDSLEMGLVAAASEPTIESLKEGMEATLRQLEQAFQSAHLKALDPEGDPFDPRQHEAMAIQEIADLTQEKVVTVIQKGYLLNERVLRPARVVVGKPPAAPSEPSEPEGSDSP